VPPAWPDAPPAGHLTKSRGALAKTHYTLTKCDAITHCVSGVSAFSASAALSADRHVARRGVPLCEKGNLARQRFMHALHAYFSLASPRSFKEQRPHLRRTKLKEPLLTEHLNRIKAWLAIRQRRRPNELLFIRSAECTGTPGAKAQLHGQYQICQVTPQKRAVGVSVPRHRR